MSFAPVLAAVIRLYNDSNGVLRFADSALTPRLRAYAERKRLEGEHQQAEHERLFAENMALLGEGVPAPPGPVFRHDPEGS